MVILQEILSQLEDGPLYAFAAWPNKRVKAVAAGVYTIWNDLAFMYVGMSGKKVTGDAEPSPGNDFSGALYKRLHSHASGSRGGDQFCLLVCDRLILPTLTRDELDRVGKGHLSLDEVTQSYITSHLSYRYAEVSNGSKALEVETMIKRGALRAGKPLLNGS